MPHKTKIIAFLFSLLGVATSQASELDSKEMEVALVALNEVFAEYSSKSTSELESLGFGHRKVVDHQNGAKLYVEFDAFLNGTRMLAINSEYPTNNKKGYVVANRRLEFAAGAEKEILPISNAYESENEREQRVQWFEQR